MKINWDKLEKYSYRSVMITGVSGIIFNTICMYMYTSNGCSHIVHKVNNVTLAAFAISMIMFGISFINKHSTFKRKGNEYIKK